MNPTYGTVGISVSTGHLDEVKTWHSRIVGVVGVGVIVAVLSVVVGGGAVLSIFYVLMYLTIKTQI